MIVAFIRQTRQGIVPYNYSYRLLVVYPHRQDIWWFSSFYNAHEYAHSIAQRVVIKC